MPQPKLYVCLGPCGQAKPRSSYGDKVDAHEGRRPWCKLCVAKESKDRKERKARERAAAGVPVMITAAVRAQLLALGVTPEQIAEMTPQQAHAFLTAAANATPEERERWANLNAFDAGELSESQDPAAEVDERSARERAERDRRRASDFDPMRPEDFESDPDEYDVGLGGDPNMGHEAGRHNRAARSTASKEKRQEYNAAMGRFASDLRDAAMAAHKNGGKVILPPDDAGYIGKLAEQERRYGTRRMARSISLAEAHEELSRRASRWVAERYFSDKVEPAGYARITPDRRGKRTVCLLLSDLHLGSELDSLDEPITFRATEEARRLEYVLRQLIDYKPQYRDQTEFLLLIIGDVIEGQLMHDFRAGSPLTEQKAIFWNYMREFIAQTAAHYPSGRVFMTPGNHGRDKVRHPGRATARKWDGHEWEMYYALQQMCSGLQNVEWSLPFRAVEPIELHGSHLLATHADTEVKVGDPDSKAKENARILDRINSTKIYGVEFDGAAFGHYHKPRYIPGRPRQIYNGALVPPNGHARSSGYIGEPCGQFLWEAVEGYPIGDVRFIEVGLAQDHDERLGTIIKPFRFTTDD